MHTHMRRERIQKNKEREKERVGENPGKGAVEIFQALRTTSVNTHKLVRAHILLRAAPPRLVPQDVELDLGSEKVKNDCSSSLLKLDSLAIGFPVKHKQLSQNIINTQTRPLCDHDRVRQKKRTFSNHRCS